MNDDIITDLKQFISATISQQTSELKQDINRLDTKIDDLSAAVAEALETANEASEVRLKDHDLRITKLENKLA